MYRLLRKTEAGLKEISENHEIGSNKLEMAYVSGLGFGLMSGAFALVNVLADSVSFTIFIPCSAAASGFICVSPDPIGIPG